MSYRVSFKASADKALNGLMVDLTAKTREGEGTRKRQFVVGSW